MKFPKILEYNLKLDFEIWKKPLNCVYFCFSLQITPKQSKTTQICIHCRTLHMNNTIYIERNFKNRNASNF